MRKFTYLIVLVLGIAGLFAIPASAGHFSGGGCYPGMTVIHLPGTWTGTAADECVGEDPDCCSGSNNNWNAMDGADIIYGGAGTDILRGSDGPDDIWGQGHGDTVYGGNGQDEIFDGGCADDYLLGGANDDELVAGCGADTIDGGNGFDTWVKQCNTGTNDTYISIERIVPVPDSCI